LQIVVRTGKPVEESGRFRAVSASIPGCHVVILAGSKSPVGGGGGGPASPPPLLLPPELLPLLLLDPLPELLPELLPLLPPEPPLLLAVPLLLPLLPPLLLAVPLLLPLPRGSPTARSTTNCCGFSYPTLPKRIPRPAMHNVLRDV
jgi:hypothetical protein